MNQLFHARHSGDEADITVTRNRLYQNNQPLAPFPQHVYADVEKRIRKGDIHNRPAETPQTIFVSYATEMRVRARSVSEFLSDIGHDVWFDEWRLNPNDDLDRAIKSSIEKCTYIVVCLSSHCGDPSRYVNKEIALATQKAKSSKRLVLVPYVLDDTDATSLCDFHPILATSPHSLTQLALTIQCSGDYLSLR